MTARLARSMTKRMNVRVKKNKKLLEKIICALMLSVGIGLCIGGLFVPFLMVFGAPLVASGLGLFANIVHDNEKIHVSSPTINNFNAYGDIEHEAVDDDKTPKRKQTIYRFKFREDKSKPLFSFRWNKEKNSKGSSVDEPSNDTDKSYSHLPQEVRERIIKINELISDLDEKLIDKISKETNENSHRHHAEVDR